MKTRIIQNEPERNHDAAERAAASRTGWRAWVARHRLVTFFVLSFVLAWSTLPLDWLGIWPQERPFQAIGVLIAAITVIAVAEGKAGFAELGRRIIRWRVPWYYYAFALAMPVLVRFGASLFNSAPMPQWADLSWSSFLLFFAIRLVNPMDGPLAEEPAWRGYAVPRLQERRSALTSAAILGVLIAAWHLPLIEDTGAIGIFTTFVITFVYSWLFNRTGGSVLLSLLFHDAQGFITFEGMGYTGDALARQQLIECAGWIIVVLVLLVADRKVWR